MSRLMTPHTTSTSLKFEKTERVKVTYNENVKTRILADIMHRMPGKLKTSKDTSESDGYYS